MHVAVLGSGVIGTQTMYVVVPTFVAIMVWLIRVLIIGTFSMAGERLFSLAEGEPAMLRSAIQNNRRPIPMSASFQPKPMQRTNTPIQPTGRVEPTYQPVAMAGGSKARPSFGRNETHHITRT